MWFLRQWLRKKMPPIQAEHARRWKSNLSLIYVVLAWNVLGLVFYGFMNKSLPKTGDNKTVNYAKILGVDNARVMKVSGISKVGEYDITLTDEEMGEFVNTEKQ